jgi:DNA-binding IclR family transcriptional regulator
MGQVARLSCSASGHAWLSCLPDDEALSLVKAQGLGSRKEYGPRAPETEQALLRYLRMARKRGFAIVEQTYTPWTNAIAAPIRHPKSLEVSGVVVLAGPAVRFTEPRMSELSSALLRSAQELSFSSSVL